MMKTTNLIPTLTYTPWLFVTLQSLVNNATRSSHDKWWSNTGISTRSDWVWSVLWWRRDRDTRNWSWQHLVNHPDIIRLIVSVIIRIVIVIWELRPFGSLKGALIYFIQFFYVLEFRHYQMSNFYRDDCCSVQVNISLLVFGHSEILGLILK